MPQTRGYTPKVQRCLGGHDGGAKGRTNVIRALLGEILLTVILLQPTVNAAVFNAWMMQRRDPKTSPQQRCYHG